MNRLFWRFTITMLLVLVGIVTVLKVGTQSAGRQSAMRVTSLYAQLLLEVAPLQSERSLKKIERSATALASGRPMTARLVRRPAHLPKLALRNLEAGRPAVHFGHRRGARVYVPLEHHPGTVLELGPESPRIFRPDLPIVGMLLSIVLILVAAGLSLSWPLWKRLTRLRRTAEQLASGELDARAEVAGKDAVGQLAVSFNEMAGRLSNLLHDQEQLLQAVSHELRTPLSRLRFGLDLLAREKDQAKREERAGALHEDVDELDELVEELTLFMRLEEGVRRLSKEPLDIQASIRAVEKRLPSRAEQVTIELALDGGSELDADPRLFRRTLQNLLLNAKRHAKSRILISSELRGDQLCLVVEDDGEGIPEGDRERIFEPFIRLDESRSRDSGGSGLGLSIVQRVLTAHGGTVSVTQSKTLGGARFETRWPRS